MNALPKTPLVPLFAAVMLGLGGCATVTPETSPLTTVPVTVIEREGGWKVEPGVRAVSRNTRVRFTVDGEGASADVYMLDPKLFKKRRVRVTKDGDIFLNVNPNAHHGTYPYYVVVKDAQGNFHVAEGNSMPVFIME